MVLTPYDTRSFLRSAAFGVLLCALGFVVMWVTDGATTSLGGKVARLSAMAPVLGAIGCAMARVHATVRGEPLALQSIGVSHTRMLAGPLAAAVVVGGLGALTLATHYADLTALFPSLNDPVWAPRPDGSWLSAADGVIVRAGTPPFVFIDALPSMAQGAPPRMPVVAAVALSTAALAAWMARPVRATMRVVVGGAAVLTTIVAFHLVAAARCGGWALVTGPLLLAGHALIDGTVDFAKRRRLAS